MTKIETHNNTNYERIMVECYSGYKVNERPVAFTFQGRRWEISDIIDRWYEGGTESDRPVIDYFKIKTKEDRIFILMYIGHVDEWFIRY